MFLLDTPKTTKRDSGTEKEKATKRDSLRRTFLVVCVSSEEKKEVWVDFIDMCRKEKELLLLFHSLQGGTLWCGEKGMCAHPIL